MKRLLIAAAAALLTLGAMAKTADQLRVYINPGHGSWTANDRPMAIRGHSAYTRYNTDTTSFFESNTNLRKAFGILEKLRQMGLKYDETLNQTGERWQIGAALDMDNNIVMSHVKCGPYYSDNGTASQLTNAGKTVPADLSYYNRSLTEIAAEVDANNFDMFISIHSNALYSDGKWYTTNYPIFLYRGYDNVSTTATGIDNSHTSASRQMALKAWPYQYKNVHEAWTAYSATSTNVRGDIDFYGSSSVNSSGYRGYLGVLKHGVPGYLVEGYFHHYAPAALRHMNWDVNYVEGYNYAHGIADYFGLTKESVGTVYGIVRDGSATFSDDTYVPNTSHNDKYKPLDNVTVKLLKNGTVVDTYVTDNQFNGAFVFNNVAPGTYTLTFSAAGYRTPDPVSVTVTAAEISYPVAFMEPGVDSVDYPDPLDGTSFGARDEYAFTTDILDKNIAQLEGCTVARLIEHGGNLYVLAHNAAGEASLLVLSGTTLDVIATPSTEGCTGNLKNLADIAVTSDGILIGSAKEICQFSDAYVTDGETRGTCRIYRWANNAAGVPEGAPTEWVTTQLTGNMYHADTGESLAYTGTIDSGRLLLSSENSYAGITNYRLWFNVLEIANGAKASESIRNKVFDNYFDYTTIGHYRLSISPRGSSCFMIDGSGVVTAEPAIDDIANTYTLMPEGTIDTLSENPGFFRYGGRSYMVAPKQSAEGNSGVVLLDITDGLDNAEVVLTTNTTIATADLGLAHAAGAGITALDAGGQVSSADMVLYLLRGSKLTRFTTEEIVYPLAPRQYAYDITVENDGTDYTVNYMSTGEAMGSAVVLTDLSDGSQVMCEGSAVVKGANSISFSSATLPGDEYSVAVRIVNHTISEGGCYYEDPNGVTNRGGVVAIRDTESDNLGYVLVTTGAANGVKIYAPDGTVSGPYFVGDSRLSSSNQSSMFRGDERNGKAVFADWSDVGAGYWVVDPSNPVDMTQLLGGERSGSQGSYAYNDVIIGGGSSCVAFQGTGANTRMLSFLEDYPSGNTPGKQNKVYAYNIGTDEQITRVPDQCYDNLVGSSFLANQNVECLGITDDVFAVAQCRGVGNNATGCPAFAFVKNDGTILLQSSACDFLDSGTSGIAISADGKMFAAGQYSGVITVMNLEWDNGTPVLTKKADLATGSNYWTHMRFDIGGNLHVYERESGGYHAYAIPDVNPVTLVPAKQKYVVRRSGGSTTVVSDIVSEDADAQAVYYNLSGVRVEADALSAGVYIKVVGDRATKVVIR